MKLGMKWYYVYVIGHKRNITILIVGIVVLLGLSGFYFWYEQDGFDEHSIVAESSSCEEGLFDSHMHLDDDGFAQTIAPLMLAHGVNCGVIFVQMDLADQEEDFSLAREALSSAPGVFVPFFDIVDDSSTVVTPDRLQNLYERSGGSFGGFGEFAFYRPELHGSRLTQDPWPAIFQFASEQDLVVMIHLSIDAANQAQLETMLARYPQTKVLIHGFERGGSGFAALLKKYPNLYFTLDTATMLKEGTAGPGPHLMYPDRGGSAREFLAQYESKKATLMAQANTEWAQVILAAPDRVMWGTDASFDWHANPEVYTTLIEFSNEFIAGLPADVQEKYKHKNAVTLFGNRGVVYEPVFDEELGDHEATEDPDEDDDETGPGSSF